MSRSMPRLFCPRTSFPHPQQHQIRFLTTSKTHLAHPLPLTASGPPPAPPTPSPHEHTSHLQRRRQQAELRQHNQDLRSAPSSNKPGAALKKRFWKDVHVQRNEDGHHTIHLDARAVRAPSTKTALRIPSSKPALAAGIALEWELLTSAAQALKTHFIPLTSLAARAHDIAAQDAGENLDPDKPPIRQEITKLLLRYLTTDTLLCWAPVKSGIGEASGLEGEEGGKGRTLREVQMQTAAPILDFLSTRVWPGVEIRPALEESGSLLPRPQEQMTVDVVRGWIAGLDAWDLAGLERAVLASKSLCVGVRLLVEWSERSYGVGSLKDGMAGGLEGKMEGQKPFTIDDAVRACSIEVEWQTGIWGEVEDTHDVEKEDLRRQLGSVVLLVSGTGMHS